MRKRTIYQSKSVFISQNKASGEHVDPLGPEFGNYLNELTRVQSCNYSFDISKTDINQFGKLAAISREIIDAPTVNIDLSYYLTNGSNEKYVGLTTNGVTSSISGLLNGSTDEKNIFVLITPEGTDAIDKVDLSTSQVIGIGNTYISNYSVEASVGGVPTANVSFEALNMNAINGNSGDVPAINPENGLPVEGVSFVIPTPSGQEAGQVAALRPGDINIELSTQFGAEFSGAGSANIQSFNLSVPFSRQNLDRLGSRYSYSKEMQFPMTVSLSVNALLADLKAGSLSDVICNEEKIDAKVTLREPSCTGQGPIAMIYELKNATLDSQSFSSSIGDNGETVDLTWSAQIGGPEDLLNGLFITSTDNVV